MTSPREAEPQTKSRAPALAGVAFAALVIVGTPWLFIRSKDGRGDAMDVTPPGTSEELLSGQRVYQRVCVGCHEPRGAGRARQYPSLVGSPWLVADPETPIRVVLLGMKGPMENGGERYDNVMPNFGVLLSDREIAHVLTFCRATWGNKASAITEQDVAKVRASLGGRSASWTGPELLGARETSTPR
jgi:mono/diheme cytochrome c family protein